MKMISDYELLLKETRSCRITLRFLDWCGMSIFIIIFFVTRLFRDIIHTLFHTRTSARRLGVFTMINRFSRLSIFFITIFFSKNRLNRKTQFMIGCFQRSIIFINADFDKSWLTVKVRALCLAASEAWWFVFEGRDIVVVIETDRDAAESFDGLFRLCFC